MKKKLEAELISIAHRILKLKNKSELIQLHREAQNLYEKLSVLLFVEENFSGAKPTIGYAEIIEKLETAFEKIEELEAPQTQAPIETKTETTAEPEAAEEEVIQIESKEPEPVVDEEEVEEQPETVAETEEAHEVVGISESADEETDDAGIPLPMESESEQAIEEESFPVPVAAQEHSFKPAFELSFEPKETVAKEEIKEETKQELQPEKAQISFEDLLGPSYADPIFVKPEEIKKEEVKKEEAEPKGPTGDSAFVSASQLISNYKAEAETKSHTLNDRLSKGITIGLNDRMAFIKQLFGGSDEDYNRVLSQLITYDTLEEAENFIDDMVKPDYNNWEGKDEYSKRFMEIIERKFS